MRRLFHKTISCSYPQWVIVLGRGKGLESNFEGVYYTQQGTLSLSMSHYFIICNKLHLISVSNAALDIELDSMSVVPKMWPLKPFVITQNKNSIDGSNRFQNSDTTTACKNKNMRLIITDCFLIFYIFNRFLFMTNDRPWMRHKKYNYKGMKIATLFFLLL